MSSSSSPSSLHLSLNRKVELDASSPDASLQSLGITSGDLVFYSLNPNSFSPTPTLAPDSSLQQPPPQIEPKSEKPETLIPVCQNRETPEPKVENFETPVGEIPNRETLIQDLTVHEQSEGSGSAKSDDVSSNLDSQKDATMTQGFSGAEDMDVDGDVDGDGSVVMGKKCSEPCFLRRILREELGDDGSDHKLLVIAVHAVLVETGFVGFDSVSGLRVDGFHLSDEWPSTALTMSLWYTLPELLVGRRYGSNGTETVVLKFQSLGQFVNVYGSLAKGGSEFHRVCLDKYRFAPTIDLVWAKNDSSYKMNEKDASSTSYPENEVFEFWKIVKDGLALPLLIDLCERAGLLPPPCFVRLPTEIKLKILESLTGADIARVACVCSELRYLSSNNDLWKQKFVEEFGNATRMQDGIQWKETFASFWESKKKRKREATTRWQGFPRVYRPSYYPRRDPNPFGVPHIIGGDHDILPGLGIPSPFGQPGAPFPRFQFRRNFSPNCNLGGFNGY